MKQKHIGLILVCMFLFLHVSSCRPDKINESNIDNVLSNKSTNDSKSRTWGSEYLLDETETTMLSAFSLKFGIDALIIQKNILNPHIFNVKTKQGENFDQFEVDVQSDNIEISFLKDGNTSCVLDNHICFSTAITSCAC